MNLMLLSHMAIAVEGIKETKVKYITGTQKEVTVTSFYVNYFFN